MGLKNQCYEIALPNKKYPNAKKNENHILCQWIAFLILGIPDFSLFARFVDDWLTSLPYLS